MTKYPLEWGWDQPNNEKPSTGSEWRPKPTLLGSHDGDVDIAAVGDLRCDGLLAEVDAPIRETAGALRCMDSMLARCAQSAQSATLAPRTCHPRNRPKC